jgi:hypothetical protein
MGALTLGLFKGAGDQFQRHMAQKAEAEAAAKKAEREAAAKRELAVFEAGVERQNLEYKLGAESKSKLALETQKQLFERENLKYRLDAEGKQALKLEEQKQAAKTKSEREKQENLIAGVFGWRDLDGNVVDDTYEGPKRLPTPVEQGTFMQQKAKSRTPIVLPSGLTAYGVKEAYEESSGGGQSKTSFGYITVPDTNIPGAAIEISLPKSQAKVEGERVKENLQGILGKTMPHFKAIMQQQQAGDPDGSFATLRRAFITQGGKALMEEFRETEGKDGAASTYRSPVEFFGINKIKDAKVRDWYITNLVEPTLNWSSDLIKDLAGIPADLPTNPAEVLSGQAIREKAKYGWALTDGPTPTLKPEVKQAVEKLNKFSGVRPQDIMGFAANTENKVGTIASITKDTELFNQYVNVRDGALDLPMGTDAMINNFYTKYGAETPEEQIALIRMMVPKNEVARSKTVRVDGGKREMVYPYRQAKYGIDSKESRLISEAARDGLKIIDNMLALNEANIATTGLPATLVRLSGGIQNMAEGLIRMTAGVQMSAERRAELDSNIEKLRNFDYLNVSSNTAEAQNLFDMLGEQLAFAMASIAQRGASGRAISDRDVEAWRAKLGLRGFLANDRGVRRNLEYLQENMNKQFAVHDKYSRNQKHEDFIATNIYDRTNNISSRTIDDLVASAKADLSNDPRNPKTADGTSKPTQEVPVYDPLTGKTKMQKVAPR